MVEKVLHYFKSSGLSKNSTDVLLSKLKSCHPDVDISVDTELCYNVAIKGVLDDRQNQQLLWLLAQCFEEDRLSATSWLSTANGGRLLEYGPRLNFATAFSTNAISIFQSVGLTQIDRIEISRRYLFKLNNCNDCETEKNIWKDLPSLLHDKMTEVCYPKSLQSFVIDIKPDGVSDIDIIGLGKRALEKANLELGLALDEWDIEYYTNLFCEKLKRNPTNVECFDLAQSNSEHSRHWFFKGEMIIDGKKMDKCLMELVSDTQKSSNDNNVIKFADNSSAIKGFDIKTLIPTDCQTASMYRSQEKQRHILLTAETHNFPTGVCPFPGATTGTGGRIRDTHAAGTGSHVIAATAGYCFGNLQIPGYQLPWEQEFKYPSNFASPLEVAIEASNGASDYGNKFGEPVICGFARSFGMLLADEERREWIKPIMFSAGIGAIDNEHIKKKSPQPGMKVLKIGGPVYRIGVGGGAASSIQVQGDNAEELDFGAVQRGDAEMEQKLNRLIRACIEMGEENPICSIHDQGAGGNGNVLKEICEPAGAVIRTGEFQLGDPTLSLLEIWGAEYQESDAILIDKSSSHILKKIGKREKVPVSFVGDITGDGNIVLEDTIISKDSAKKQKISHAVNLPLDIVLGKMPAKVYHLERMKHVLTPLSLPATLSLEDALERVLRLPSVASKRYLTNKVDRSVTGLIAQQQCVGPLHTPLADVGVIALSHFGIVGGATAIGEQPIKMLVDAKKGARLTVAEAFTNLMFAKITDIKDVKCSANWMWPAKLPGEGARMYDACSAMSSMLSELGAAVDGGKDSLSMAARVDDHVVKAPGSLVISVYAPCTDIRLTLTPDLKAHGNSLIFVNMLGSNEWKLGGSALAQVFNQTGNEVPDVCDISLFSRSFNTIQDLIPTGMLLSGHDVSDGGLITTVLEMCFAGNLGVFLNFKDLAKEEDIISVLFTEQPGAVFEVANDNLEHVKSVLSAADVPCYHIGFTSDSGEVLISAADDVMVLKTDVKCLRNVWEDTSFRLEQLQCNPQCVESEQLSLNARQVPDYRISFQPDQPNVRDESITRPKVAVLREEGSNGDREMASCLHLAGFDVYDVTMQDLCNGEITLDSFHGLVFVGGFSYADVLGSAKGWASVAKLNPIVNEQLETFRNRTDTFSLGVCNGCQLMALLGWVGNDDDNEQAVCFTHNVSGRFESRFVNVSIEKSPSIMLQSMENSTLGIWVAHGEGRVKEKHNGILKHQISCNLAPIRYVDDGGVVTTKYPYNPNGSPDGIAALCSPDGRHLALMPHPERCFMMWQWPYVPPNLKSMATSPWLQMFHNAYKWCTNLKKEC